MNTSERLYYLAGVSTLRLDAARCRGCGACLDVCPRQVLAWRKPGKPEVSEEADVEATPQERRTVAVADADACIECGACAHNCPHKALSLTPGTGCATLIMQQWAARWGWKRKMRSGCC